MVILFIIERDVGNGVRIISELAVKSPADAFVELAVVEAHEISLDVELDDEGRGECDFSWRGGCEWRDVVGRRGCLCRHDRSKSR